jgi:YVTN family beta-propeller protein
MMPTLSRIRSSFRRAGFALALALCASIVPAAGQNARQIVPPGTIFELLALNGDLETAARPKYRSPTAMAPSPDGRFLYVAEQTAKRIAVIDLTTKSVTSEILLPNEPTGLAISADGSKLYATCSSQRWPAGLLCEIATSAGNILRKIPAGHSARSPVLSPDGSIAYVCNQYQNNISVVDLTAGKELARIPAVREAYAAAITPDGATLVVTNSLPDQAATDTSAIACKVCLISTQTRSVVAQIAMPVGSHSLFGLCISPDGKYAFATHLIGRFNIPALVITNGWVHSNNMAIIDIANKKLANDIELDAATHGVANPWSLACTGDGKFLCATHAGSGEMTIFDLPQMLAKTIGMPDLSHDFASLQAIKRTLKLTTVGPRALAIVGTKAYAAGYFDDKLDIVDISLNSSAPSGTLPLGTAKPLTTERKGEISFSDASLCLQNWQSCFSCHPFTRPDALNWILNSLSAGTPKNVKSMLDTWWTPPTSWAGKRPSAGGPSGSIRSGIAAELFTEPNEEVAVGLDTFLMRLKPLPSPYLAKGRLSTAAQTGRQIYYSGKVDCKICHSGRLFTDFKFHNAGIPDQFDANRDWDTPSLIEAWRTGPYGHLGSYTKIEDVLRVSGHSYDVSKLTSQEFSDLMQFLLSL